MCTAHCPLAASAAFVVLIASLTHSLTHPLTPSSFSCCGQSKLGQLHKQLGQYDEAVEVLLLVHSILDAMVRGAVFSCERPK